MVWSITRFGLAFGIATSTAQQINAQQLRSIQAGAETPTADTIASKSGSRKTFFSLSMGGTYGAASGSLIGGTFGLLADEIHCKQRYGDANSMWDRCFLYYGEGFAAGWFGGAVTGATARAAHMAKKRGCPRETAILRAFAGAALGAAPGISIVAARPGKYPPSRSLVILGTPLLTGVGAAAAVVGCHA